MTSGKQFDTGYAGAYVMGQAAGTAAVQALEYGQTACGLDTDALRKTLQNHRAVSA